LYEERRDWLSLNLTTETSQRKELPSFSIRPNISRRKRRDGYLSFILLVLFLTFILYSLSNYLQRLFYDPYLLGLIVFATVGFFAMLSEVRRYLRESVQTQEYRSVRYKSMERPAKKVHRSAKNQAAMVRSHCSSCGSKLLIAGSTFCANCGVSLQLTSMGDVSKREDRSTLLEDECMVCGLEMNPNDNLIWCPYCGNAAHREHFLAWLRLRQTCPICNQHIVVAQLEKLGGKARTR
jgi:uncharacterized Zn finger protein (UPF0148 family)